MKRKKALLLSFLLVFVLEANYVFSQNVEFTPRFFASSSLVSGNKYIVFIYEDYLNIVRIDNRKQRTTVKFTYISIEKCREIIVWEDELLIFARSGVMAAYDLNALCMVDNKVFSDSEHKLGIIYNVKIITFSQNKIYYLKENDRAIYEYLGKAHERKTDSYISTINTNSYMLYYPFSPQRKDEFSKSESKVTTIISNLSATPDQKFKENVEADLNTLFNPNRNRQKIFELAKNRRMGTLWVEQQQSFSEYVFLYALTGSTNPKKSIDTLRLDIVGDRVIDTNIESFYSIPVKIDRLKSEQEKNERERTAIVKYERGLSAATTNLQNKYGRNVEELSAFINFDDNIQKNNLWNTSNRQTRQAMLTELNQNKQKIKIYHEGLKKLMNNEFDIYLNQNSEYRDFYELFIAISEDTDQYVDNALRALLLMGKDLVSNKQVTMKDNYIRAKLKTGSNINNLRNDYNAYFTTKTSLENTKKIEIEGVSAQIEKEIKEATTVRIANLDVISTYVHNRFLKEVASPVFNFDSINKGNNLSSPGYNSSLLDFSVIQGSTTSTIPPPEKIVFGHSLNMDINFNHLITPVNSKSQQPAYPYPQFFTNMLINKNMMLLMKSKNAITIYKTGNMDIRKNVENITSFGDIFYIIRSENFMYYVNDAGELRRIGINKDGMVEHTRLDNYRIGDVDRVYIASRVNGTDDIYILSSDGIVNGRNPITINSRNKFEDTVTLTVSKDKITVEVR